MKAEELRIGNWIIYDSRYFQIDTIAEIFPTLKTIEFGIGIVDYRNIEPIPLTEEILLKCGFEYIEDYNRFYFIELNEWTKIYVHLFKDQCAVEVSVSKHAYVPPINSVHQLQNLYYALTGQEINIKGL